MDCSKVTVKSNPWRHSTATIGPKVLSAEGTHWGVDEFMLVTTIQIPRKVNERSLDNGKMGSGGLFIGVASIILATGDKQLCRIAKVPWKN